MNVMEKLKHEMAETFSKARTGRRRSDHVRRGGLIAMVIGVLFNGGFVPFAWHMLKQGEAERERFQAVMSDQIARQEKLLERQRMQLDACLLRLARQRHEDEQ